MDYLDTLSTFAAGLRFAGLPPEVRAHTGWVLADTLAAIAAGSAEPELRALAQRQRLGSGATLIGLGLQTHPEAAALVNGTGGTFLEMDEGNRFSRGHPAVHAIPAALALAQERRRPAEDFLAAVVAGYEVGSRLGAASALRGPLRRPQGAGAAPRPPAHCPLARQC